MSKAQSPISSKNKNTTQNESLSICNKNTSTMQSPLSLVTQNTSLGKSSSNSKTGYRKDVIIVGNCILNGVNEEGLSDDKYKMEDNHSFIKH